MSFVVSTSANSVSMNDDIEGRSIPKNPMTYC